MQTLILQTLRLPANRTMQPIGAGPTNVRMEWKEYLGRSPVSGRMAGSKSDQDEGDWM